MRIIFIRHGESTNNVIEHSPEMTKELYEELRTNDPLLSEFGKAQLDLTGKFLAESKIQINKIYCSPLQRAIQSAREIRFKIDTKIYEIGGVYHKEKSFPGNNRKFFEENYKDCVIPVEITDKGWFIKGTRETKKEAIERAKLFVNWLKKLILESKDENIIFIAHGDFLNETLRILQEVEESSQLYFKIYNATFTIFETDENNNLFLKCMNVYDHLKGLMKLNQKSPFN